MIFSCLKRKLHIEHLWIEATRRCNLNCLHCIRGRMQKVDFNPDVLDKLLPQINSIGTIYFTGGEPSFNPKIIEMFVKRVECKKIRVKQFAIASNGTFFRKELVDAMDKLYSYCHFKKGCDFGLSNDMYHKYKKEVSKEYQKLNKPYMWSNINHFGITFNPGNLVNGGNAKKNGFGGMGYEHNCKDPFKILKCKETDVVSNLPVYISVFGDVVSCNATPYDEIPKWSKGNVLEHDLYGILSNNAIC